MCNKERLTCDEFYKGIAFLLALLPHLASPESLIFHCSVGLELLKHLSSGLPEKDTPITNDIDCWASLDMMNSLAKFLDQEKIPYTFLSPDAKSPSSIRGSNLSFEHQEVKYDIWSIEGKVATEDNPGAPFHSRDFITISPAGISGAEVRVLTPQALAKLYTIFIQHEKSLAAPKERGHTMTQIHRLIYS